MKNHELRDQLRESYNAFAQARETSQPQDWKIEERATFFALLQREHKQTLLEIGAGTGRDSKFFQDQGLETVCIDLSPVMVALCRKKGLTAYEMDISELQFPPDSFDAIYSMNSLLHLPKVDLSAALGRLDLLLKTDGLVYIGVYGGYNHEGVWENDSYIPHRFFSFFSDEHLRQAVSQMFDILSFHCHFFEPGDPIHFQALVLKKRKGNI